MTNLNDSWDDDLDGADSPDDPHALDRTFPFGESFPMCADRFGNPLSHEEILRRGPFDPMPFDDDSDEDDLDAFGYFGGFDEDDEDDDERIPRPWRILCTADDVHEHLLALVGPERDGPRALWVVFLDEHDRVLPLVIPIGDLPTIVNRAMVANLARQLRTLLDENAPGGCLAFGLVRRGGGDRGTFEAGWSQALSEAMAEAGVAVRAMVAIGRDRSRVLPLGLT
ncbi:hypothetical protein [Pengzhenrongella frigida]|uniref:DUF4192 family protein n=1 Tax=Pengzhenrongella frigida TaxID=1259133 RepID=A0A4Q5MYG2_9MICO|nr:hypothetical protein [Cellulomonas sp. HLT2-17]RYV50699.1 hypothetical protein EUA98_12160 [Cellulomonas sp. HLT2-17]